MVMEAGLLGCRGRRCRALLTGFAAMVAMMVAATLVMHAQGGRIEGLFCSALVGVEGLGGFGMAVHLGHALAAHFTHLVDALGCGQLGKGFAVAGAGRSPGFMAWV